MANCVKPPCVEEQNHRFDHLTDVRDLVHHLYVVLAFDDRLSEDLGLLRLVFHRSFSNSRKFHCNQVRNVKV